MHRRVFLRHTAGFGGAALAGLHLSTIGAAAVTDSRSLPARRTGNAGARADLVLRRALIYDGSGSAPVRGDVAVTGGRIVEIASQVGAAGDRELDLDGLALAPGFIDIHSHTDMELLTDPRADSKVRQGVTTEVTGQDGGSVGWSEEGFQEARERYAERGVALDFRDVPGFLRYIDARGAALNVASMIGAGHVRGLVIGNTDRPATEAEIARLVAMVREAIDGGACGVSSGLEYTPGAFADVAELQALAAPLRGTGLPFSSHMRNEDDRLLGAMEEVIGVGHREDVAVHISHLKAQGERNWWKTDSALRLMEDARGAGVDVDFDVYPYEAYATGLSNLFPVWAREGGTDEFIARLRDTATAPGIERAVRDKIAMLGSWDSVQMSSASSPEYAWVAGGRIGTLAEQRGVEPYALLLDIIIGDRARTRMVGFGMSEENIARKLAHPLAMVCSDGGAVAFGEGVPHPRNYGTFPRVLGHYVRELKALPLEEAIRKMTRAPADRLRFNDRGRIEVDAVADLVAFDPATVADRATFAEPHQYPVGIPHVIVGGTLVIENERHTEARPGRAVRPG
ncbi:MAG TPA: D-aminoacylase [Longimicrobiales bacterium]|nr:D-aminoacylase [Longimicrobiales bacterium]